MMLFEFTHIDFPDVCDYFEKEWEARDYASKYIAAIVSNRSEYEEEMKKVRIRRVKI